MRHSYLHVVSTLLSKKYNQWYSAADQVALSALSMFFSLIVLKFSGVEAFGVYSFVFLLCQLSAAISTTVVVRQMVLHISNETINIQKQVFVDTVFIVLILFLVKLSVVLLVLFLVFKSEFNEYVALATSASLYALSLDMYDLFRQYLYVRNKQRISFLYTVMGVATSAVLLLFYIFYIPSHDLYKVLFVALAAGMTTSALLNVYTISEFTNTLQKGTSTLFLTFNKYLETGKIALLGMLLTWVQNQSLTPILMFLSGPLVVGYYNVAKMCFMPVGVIVSGFSKSLLPKLRRIYKTQGGAILYAEVAKYQKKSLQLTSIYFVIVVAIMLSAITAEVIPIESEYLMYVFCTGVIVSLSTFRFWLTQYFVTKLKFGLLLQASVIGALVSVALMLLLDFFFASVVLVIISVAIAEILVICKLKVSVRQSLQNQALESA